jgi:hypothetical protein
MACEKMHNYEDCEKALEECRWCRAKAEAIVKSKGIDVQELDSTLIFHEQPILQQIQENEDDGVHNPNVRDLMGLDKKRTNKRKPKVMEISNIMDALKDMGAPVDE